MKKLIVLTLTLCLMLAGCSSTGNNNSSSQSGEENQTTASAAFTDEMKIPHTVDLSEEDGADSVERAGRPCRQHLFRSPGLLQHDRYRYPDHSGAFPHPAADQ